MKKYKRMLAAFFAVAIAAVCCISVFAAAGEETLYYTDGDYEYIIVDGKAKISEYLGSGGDVTIPTKLGGYPVDEILYKSFSGAKVNSVSIPDGIFLEHMAFNGSEITSLTMGKYYSSAYSGILGDSYAPSYAFGSCYNLKTVTIKEGALSVFGQMFERCENLTTVFLPKSISLIDERAFHMCRNLKDVYYAGTQEQWDEIVIVFGNEYLEHANIHFNATTVHGWYQENGVWYYGRNYEKVTGWLKNGNSWYYMDDTGAMQTGWVKDGENWYYLNDAGAMLTGWQKIGMAWYYLGNSGIMQTGWLKLGSTWYYFGGSGVMATGSVNIGGKIYNFNDSGACLNP